MRITLAKFVAAVTLTILAGWYSGNQYIRYNQYHPAPEQPFHAPPPPTPINIAPEPVAPIVAHVPGFMDRLKQATVQLYFDGGDGPRFTCTATAIQKIDKGYVFLSARHCFFSRESGEFFVILDHASDAPYIRAKLAIEGGPGVDAALFTVNTSADLPVIPVGTERLVSEGSHVAYYGFPLNLGKLYFEGYISATKIGPPAYSDPQWNGDLGVTIQIGPGSSGSSLVDPNQEAIIGVMTGATINRFGGVILSMATPASSVRQLVDDYKAGRVRPPVQLGLFDLFLGRPRP
jgi:Trypsin-like peptidase domain